MILTKGQEFINSDPREVKALPGANWAIRQDINPSSLK